MLNKHLVYLLYVVELYNIWKLPLHWNAKAQKLQFNRKLKPGFCISNFVLGFGLANQFVFLMSRILIPNTHQVPVFVFIFNIIGTVKGLFTLFIQKLQYSCGTELLSFFFNIESIKTALRNGGIKVIYVVFH
jgi:hypothetical protein